MRTNGPDQRFYTEATKAETNVIQRSYPSPPEHPTLPPPLLRALCVRRRRWGKGSTAGLSDDFPSSLRSSPRRERRCDDREEETNPQSPCSDPGARGPCFENSAIRIGEILTEIKDSGAWKTEANYSTFQAHYKARQLKRIEDPLKRAEFWEKLNQGEEPVTRKRVSEGIRKEKARGPVTIYGKPYDMGK